MASLRCSNPVSQKFRARVRLARRHLNVSQINLRPGSPFTPVFFVSYSKQHAVLVPPETLPPIALDWRKLGEVHECARETGLKLHGREKAGLA